MRIKEVIYFIKAADGKRVAVPESKLKEFQALNNEIKAKMKQSKEASGSIKADEKK